MMFTPCSIHSPGVDENRSPDVGTELREQSPILAGNSALGLSNDLHFLDLSTDLKTVSCHLFSWLTI